MPYVFISYAHEDKAIVKKLVKELEDRELSVWWDKDLRPGELFRKGIERKILGALCVVVVWSPKSRDNKWVADEAQVASDKDRLIPVLAVEGSVNDIPMGFRGYLAVSIKDIESICNAIRCFDGEPRPAKKGILSWLGFGGAKTRLQPRVQVREHAPEKPAQASSPRSVPKTANDLPSRTDQGVNFKLAEPQHLDRIAVVAQCLDNSWASRHLQIKQMQEGLSLAEVSDKREPEVRRGFIRSLLSAQQVVINRAFLYNNHVLVSCYTNTQERADFQALLSDQSILPFLYSEDSPVTPVKFDVLPESELWRSVAASSDLTCLRLDWESSRNEQLIRKHLAQRFHEFAQNLNMLDPEVVCADLQLEAAEEVTAALKSKLREVARFAFDASETGLITRNELYRKFIAPEGANISEGRIDRSKPFAVQLKELFDLKYNINLPDALDRFALTPVDSAPRSALQEVQQMARRPQSMDVRELMRVLANIRFEDALGIGENIPLERASLGTVRKVRQSAAFERYLSVARDIVPDHGKPISGLSLFAKPDETVSALTAAYREVLNEISKGQEDARERWRPRAEIVIRIGGTTLGLALSRTAGSDEMFLSAPQDVEVKVPAGAPISIEWCIVDAGQRRLENQKFGARLHIVSAHLDNVKDGWNSILDQAAELSRQGAFTLNLMPENRYHNRHADTGGLEQRDENETVD